MENFIQNIAFLAEADGVGAARLAVEHAVAQHLAAWCSTR
jgi:hypothetical protein